MITRLRNGREIDTRAFALSDMIKWGYSALRGAGPQVTADSVRGVPAIHRAARIRAEALASLRLRCWRGDPRARVDAVWQSKLFARAANSYQTRFGFWETAGESLAYRNNAYIWKNVDPASSQVVEWFALHPDQVACKGDGSYEVDVRDGYLDPVGRGKARYIVGPDTILHIRGHGDGGTYEAPSPIQVFRDALTSPLERQKHEGRMWRKGTALQLAATFPQGVDTKQAEEWREMWRNTHEGTDGSTTAVIGGGATLQPIGMTARDAEFVAMAHLTVEDAARIMGVPADLLDLRIGEKADALEDVLRRWYVFGLGPELERIESALAADQELFGLARTFPGFDSDEVVRGDVKTEDDIAHQQIQDGRLLVDEWRIPKGLPPLPGGVGKIPQVVPVGGGPNPGQPSPNGKAPAAQ